MTKYQHRFGVSVVIPCYNRKEKLISAIESIKSSNKELVEIIVVDDCSFLSPSTFLNNVNSDGIPIRLYNNSNNSGPQVARNLGIRRARFNYIAFLDSDDLFVNGKMDWLLRILRNGDIDFLYHGVDGCEKYNKISRVWFRTLGKILHFKWLLYLLNPCVTPSVVIKKKKCLFNPQLRYSEDYAFFLSYINNETRIKYYDEIYTLVPREIGTTGGVSGNLVQMRKGELQGKKNILRDNSKNKYIGYALSCGFAYLRVIADILRKRYSIKDFMS